MARHDVVDEAAHLVGLRDVDGGIGAGLDVAGDHGGTGVGEGAGEARPEPLRGSRDDGDLPGDVAHGLDRTNLPGPAASQQLAAVASRSVGSADRSPGVTHSMAMSNVAVDTVVDAFQLGGTAVGGTAAGSPADRDFPLMPLGQAVDMGHGPDGTPLIDPRLFDTVEFQRNPYPYYRIMRDHYPVFHDKLHNCYYVTRYEDITDCYFDALMWNTIPKGSSNGVLGNTQLELSGVEHGRRRNLYGRHLVGKALTKRIPAIERLAAEMLASWLDPAAGVAEVDPVTGRRTIELGRAFANEFPIRVVCQVLGFPDEARGDFFYWYSSMMTGLGGSETHHQGVQARQDLEDYVEGLVEERRTRADLPVRRRRQPDHHGHHLRAVPLGGRRRRALDRGDHVEHRPRRRGRRRDDSRRHPQHVVPAAAAPRPVRRRSWPTTPCGTRRSTRRCATPPRSVASPATTASTPSCTACTIPAGSLVHMVDFSANHDERIFAEPGDVRHLPARPLQRQDPAQRLPQGGQCSHMAFGVGPHLCPGAWISHQESVLGSRLIVKHMRDPRIAVDRMPKDIDGVSLAPIGLGAIRELWLDFEPV